MQRTDLLILIFPPQIWFYTNDIFKNADIPEPEIPYTTAGTGIIEIIAGLIGVNLTNTLSLTLTLQLSNHSLNY